MQNKQTSDARKAGAPDPAPGAMPDAAALAALRAWYEGISARDSVRRYLGHAKAEGQSSRGILGGIRRQLASAAAWRRREDLAELFVSAETRREQRAAPVAAAIDTLGRLPISQPRLDDDVARWFDARAANALHAQRIRSLGELTLRVPRRRMWWRAIPRLGATGARKIEAFFAAHPGLTEKAHALVQVAPSDVAPWEHLRAPDELSGANGVFRAPWESCTLLARNDHGAVTAWLERHESAATQRAYRKEAERLILWSILERGKALSSLAVEDATAYRAFLRRPSPYARWVGPPRPRESVEWRPFAGALSARSVAYALGVLSALFRWLVEQRYVLANPFSGLKVRGAGRDSDLDAGRSFTDGEWQLVRTVADGLEWSYGWSEPAAQRLRFLIDFCYATGLRASELAGATLGAIASDGQGDEWLHLAAGKGARRGKVALPPLARAALDRYLVQRGLPTTRAKWKPGTPILGRVDTDDARAITASRLWVIVRRFFAQVAKVIEDDRPALAQKLRLASPHWMRHTHASHALQAGVELTTVRDNLRHASIATTSVYLHGDDAKRHRQLCHAFGVR